MPHRHSANAHRLRQLRANSMGFLRAKPAVGKSWVAVPNHLIGRAKAMLSSVSLHVQHDRTAGTVSHFARSAAIAARLPPPELDRALRIHRAANHAKHEWKWAATSPSEQVDLVDDPRQLQDPCVRVQPKVCDARGHLALPH